MHHAHPAPYQGPPEILNRVDIVGPLDPAVAATLAPQLEFRPQPGPEMEKTPEDHQQLMDMKESWVRLGRDLGVDISRRVPSNAMIHYLDGPSMQKFRRDRQLPDNWLGGIAPDGNMYIDGTQPTTLKLDMVNSQLAKAVGYYPWHVEKRADAGPDKHGPINPGDYVAKRSRIGYADLTTGRYNMLNTLVAEKMGREVRERYWSQYGSLAPHAERNLRTTQGLVQDLSTALSEEMVAKVAHTTHQTPNKVWGDVMKGVFTGDMATLQPFVDTFGEQAMDMVAELQTREVAAVGRTAVALGVRFGENYHIPM